MVNDKSALAVETMVKSSIVKPQGLNGKSIAAPAGGRELPTVVSNTRLRQNRGFAALARRFLPPRASEKQAVLGALRLFGQLSTLVRNCEQLAHPPLGFITRPEFAEQNPQAIRDFIRGTVYWLLRILQNISAGDLCTGHNAP